MNFTFPARKVASGCYDVTVKLDGEQLTIVRTDKRSRKDAIHEAKLVAEAYGYIDGVN